MSTYRFEPREQETQRPADATAAVGVFEREAHCFGQAIACPASSRAAATASDTRMTGRRPLISGHTLAMSPTKADLVT
jgi:hypothetical protein